MVVLSEFCALKPSLWVFLFLGEHLERNSKVALANTSHILIFEWEVNCSLFTNCNTVYIVQVIVHF